jgi:hypothetical protein
MDVYFWLEMEGALTAVVLLLLFARLLTGRLILPAKAYPVLSFAGLAAYVGFMFISGQSSRPTGGVLAEVWDQWLMISRLLLPLVSGLLGWATLRSFWRWWFLGAGIGLLLLPWVGALIVNSMGSGPSSGG